MQQQVREGLEESQIKSAHPSGNTWKKEMHSMKASADKKLLGNCQAGQRIVLTGSYRQKTYKLLLELYTMSTPPPQSCIFVV